MKSWKLLVSGTLSVSLIILTGCSSLVKQQVVEARPARTNLVQVLVTNTITTTEYVTNVVVTAASTNATGVVTPPSMQTQILPQLVLSMQVTTNVTGIVTPALYYTNVVLDPTLSSGVQTVGNLIPVPFAGTVASGLLALSTLVFGFLNNRNKAKVVALADAHSDTLSALDQAKLVGQTLVQNIETIRGVALQVPGYAEQDAKVMSIVQQVQRAAGVKTDVHDLVEKHT